MRCWSKPPAFGGGRGSFGLASLDGSDEFEELFSFLIGDLVLEGFHLFLTLFGDSVFDGLDGFIILDGFLNLGIGIIPHFEFFTHLGFAFSVFAVAGGAVFIPNFAGFCGAKGDRTEGGEGGEEE